nr:reverse transcriptase domain-containing protein [Tanacetum cinerariifolium]GEX84303.1 reverse transcriptase domain-containing protein [Tanacetum cinerariifolium]
MYTHASNSELVEPLPKPERTLNRRLHRRNRRVPFDQRNNLPQQLRIIYPPFLNVNYFRHFIGILRNYDPMDDEPVWAADHVVAPTLGSTITILEIVNEFSIKSNHLTLVKGNQFNDRTKIDPHKHIHEFLGICDTFKYKDTKNEVIRLMMFPLSLTEEVKTWLDELNEGTIKMWDELRTVSLADSFPSSFRLTPWRNPCLSQHENESLIDAWLHMKEMLRNCHAGGIFLYKTPNLAYQLLEDKVLLKLDWAKNQKTKSSLKKTVAFADEGSSNFKTDKIIARMDAMTIKMDAQYKELQSRAKQPTPDLDDDDMSMSREEEAKFMQTFHNPDDQQNNSESPINFDSNDEDDKPTPQPKTQPTNPVKETSLPKPYKSKIPYTQRLRKEKMKAQYGKFLDMIRVVKINVPLVDVLAGMPNYGKFLKELISNKHKIEQISTAFLSDESSAMIQNKVPPKLEDPESFLIPCNFNKTLSCNSLADLGASINLMPYSLYAKLSLETLKPTKMSVRLADRSFQYPARIAKNMLIEVGKFTFPADFVILEMEEDNKKQLNLGVRTERMIFNIDSVMKHSYSNDDTCFSIDVIDEILEEEFNALLDKGSKILHSIEGILLEEKTFSESDEFMAIAVDENSESESDTEEPPFEKIINTDYKIKTSLEEPPMDLKLKPLLDNLEYVFLEEPSFLHRCKDAYLVLNWEKCHFMVKEGIVLGHKVSSARLKVDKAKIDVISKLSSPTNIKDVKKMVKLSPIYFASKTLNSAQQKYTVTEKELMAVVFAFDKFRSYLILSKTIIHNDHSALKHLFKKQDAKPRLIYWILLLQEFNIEIKDRKGTENVAADHLSRIKNDESSDDSEVDDNFPRETLMEINTKDEPWFADFANYLVANIIPKGMTYQQKNKFFSDLKHYFWKEPYLFKVCSDGMTRRYVSGSETQTILDQCHHGPTGGHYGPNVTAKKGIDFMGTFPKLHKFEYILVDVDYVSKWAKAQALPTNNARVVVTFLKKLFCCFRMPKALISDRGSLEDIPSSNTTKI